VAESPEMAQPCRREIDQRRRRAKIRTPWPLSCPNGRNPVCPPLDGAGRPAEAHPTNESPKSTLKCLGRAARALSTPELPAGPPSAGALTIFNFFLYLETGAPNGHRVCGRAHIAAGKEDRPSPAWLAAIRGAPWRSRRRCALPPTRSTTRGPAGGIRNGGDRGPRQSACAPGRPAIAARHSPDGSSNSTRRSKTQRA